MNTAFVSAPLPPPISQSLHRLCHGMKDTEWVDQENMHLTLRYIGQIKGHQLHDIAEALQDIQLNPILLQIKGLGHFIKKRGVTLYAQIAKSNPLNKLKSEIDKMLNEAELPKNRAHYLPHITIGYYQGKKMEAAAHFLERNSFFETEIFEINNFDLTSCHKSLKGSIYTEEASYPLRKPKY
ncbi:MAG: 2'-5' RNA ligase [Chlamydiales bacterium]|jgi:2'-5' RNA ligase